MIQSISNESYNTPLFSQKLQTEASAKSNDGLLKAENSTVDQAKNGVSVDLAKNRGRVIEISPADEDNGEIEDFTV